jgi:hypothetical protein
VTTYRRFSIKYTSLLLPIVILANYASSQSKPTDYGCTEAKPEVQCVAANTCGSASTPCEIDVKRTANAASATPSIPGAKGNSLVCVKVGTTVQWKSTGRNIGFVVDLGPNSPFDPNGAIMGGSDRAISVVAKRPGCFKYSAGACMSGAIYGMCGQANPKLIVIP